MARRLIAELKRGALRGNALAALQLLDRSIRFRYKKLAVLRFLIAEQLGASLSEQQHAYCMQVGRTLTQAEISALLSQVRRFRVDRRSQGGP